MPWVIDSFPRLHIAEHLWSFGRYRARGRARSATPGFAFSLVMAQLLGAKAKESRRLPFHLRFAGPIGAQCSSKGAAVRGQNPDLLGVCERRHPARRSPRPQGRNRPNWFERSTLPSSVDETDTVRLASV